MITMVPDGVVITELASIRAGLAWLCRLPAIAGTHHRSASIRLAQGSWDVRTQDPKRASTGSIGATRMPWAWAVARPQQAQTHEQSIGLHRFGGLCLLFFFCFFLVFGCVLALLLVRF